MPLVHLEMIISFASIGMVADYHRSLGFFVRDQRLSKSPQNARKRKRPSWFYVIPISHTLSFALFTKKPIPPVLHRKLKVVNLAFKTRKCERRKEEVVVVISLIIITGTRRRRRTTRRGEERRTNDARELEQLAGNVISHQQSSVVFCHSVARG